MNYCTRCIMPNPRPDEYLNSEHVCNACLSFDYQNKINYENLARGDRTLFINVKTRDLNCKSFLPFEWPKKYKNEGKFWLNSIDKKKKFEKLDFPLYSSNSKWNLIDKQYIKQIMVFDKNKKKLIQ